MSAPTWIFESTPILHRIPAIFCPARRDLNLGVLFSVHNGDAERRAGNVQISMALPPPKKTRQRAKQKEFREVRSLIRFV